MIPLKLTVQPHTDQDGSLWHEAQLDFGWVRVWQEGNLIKRVIIGQTVAGSSHPELERLLRQVWFHGLEGLNLRFDFSGVSRFTQKILAACAKIRFGEVKSYGELAAFAGAPGAARAVGQVMAHNRFAIFFPCHRVVGANGRLGGFTGGIRIKRRLLEFEGWKVRGSGFNARLCKAGSKIF